MRAADRGAARRPADRRGPSRSNPPRRRRKPTVCRGDGRDARRAPRADVVVPPTIQALLAARLDQLQPEERVVLERGVDRGRDLPSRRCPGSRTRGTPGSRPGCRRSFARSSSDRTDRNFRETTGSGSVTCSFATRRTRRSRRRPGQTCTNTLPTGSSCTPPTSSSPTRSLATTSSRRTTTGWNSARSAWRRRRSPPERGKAAASASGRALLRDDLRAAVNLLERTLRLLPPDSGRGVRSSRPRSRRRALPLDQVRRSRGGRGGGDRAGTGRR